MSYRPSTNTVFNVNDGCITRQQKAHDRALITLHRFQPIAFSLSDLLIRLKLLENSKAMTNLRIWARISNLFLLFLCVDFCTFWQFRCVSHWVYHTAFGLIKTLFILSLYFNIRTWFILPEIKLYLALYLILEKLSQHQIVLLWRSFCPNAI